MCKCLNIITMALTIVGAMAYIPVEKEQFLTEALLRNIVGHMGNNLADNDDNYIDFSENSRLPMMMGSRRSAKDLDTAEEQLFDYDSLGEPSNLHPSLRDHEYLQHSTLWGSQYMSGGAGEGKQHLKPEGSIKNHQEVKTDSTLPAYCNPPNPCPIGYDEDQGCTSNLKFENTAAFSRRYQSAQDCMCDTEHMFECPSQSERTQNDQISNSFGDLDFDHFLHQTLKNNDINLHKSLVAKKYFIKKSENQNPYLLGEKLPVAAKKGQNVFY